MLISPRTASYNSGRLLHGIIYLHPITNGRVNDTARRHFRALRALCGDAALRNVVLANKSDVIYYEVVTPKWARDRTTVSRLDPNTRQFDIVGEMKNDERGKRGEVSRIGEKIPCDVPEYMEETCGSRR